MAEALPAVAADPYPWPFDGRWSADDTALLLLGFQNGIVAWLAARTEVDFATRVAAAARATGMSVIATRRGHESAPTPVANRRAPLGDRVAEVGTADWALAAGVTAIPGLQIVDHPGDNAFYATNLEATLRARKIDRLLIAGLTTDGLVHATMRAANDLGLECLLLSDATAGTTPDRHDAQLRITAFGNGLFGACAASVQVLRALGGERDGT